MGIVAGSGGVRDSVLQAVRYEVYELGEATRVPNVRGLGSPLVGYLVPGDVQNGTVKEQVGRSLVVIKAQPARRGGEDVRLQ